MVKTVHGNLGMDELEKGLTEHIRKLPSYTTVVSDTFRLDSRHYGLSFEIREPYEEKCWDCEGTGKHNYGTGKKPDYETCPICDGSGKQTQHHVLSARVSEDSKGLRIEVGTEGKDIEKWRPDVERIKSFLEGLVGRPFVVVPMSKKERLKEEMGRVEEKLQQTLELVEKNQG